jgi:cell division initiation protein
MRITPIEIQQQQFKTRMFGYDTSAVDNFLEMLADELERLHKQNNELKESLARTRSSLDQMREREHTLQQTLMTAQQVTEDLKENARKEAEIVVANAHLEGERVIRDANERRMKLANDLQEMKRQKLTFESGLRTLVENHLKLLDMDILQIEEDESLVPLMEPLISDDDIDERLDFP